MATDSLPSRCRADGGGRACGSEFTKFEKESVEEFIRNYNDDDENNENNDDENNNEVIDSENDPNIEVSEDYGDED